jgi:hypothetical protein
MQEVDLYLQARNNVPLAKTSSEHFVAFYGPQFKNQKLLPDFLGKLETAAKIYMTDFKLPFPTKNKIAVYIFNTGQIQPPEPGPGVAAYGGNGKLVVNNAMDWCVTKDSFHELAHVFNIGWGFSNIERKVIESWATFLAVYVLHKLRMQEDYGVDDINRFRMIHQNSGSPVDSEWKPENEADPWGKVGYSWYQGWHLQQYIYNIYGLDFTAQVLNAHQPNTRLLDVVCAKLKISRADFITQYISNFITLKACSIKTSKWNYFGTAKPLQWEGYQVVDLTPQVSKKTKAIVKCNCGPYPQDWRLIYVIAKPDNTYENVLYKSGIQTINITVNKTWKYWLALAPVGAVHPEAPVVSYSVV